MMDTAMESMAVAATSGTGPPTPTAASSCGGGGALLERGECYCPGVGELTRLFALLPAVSGMGYENISNSMAVARKRVDAGRGTYCLVQDK
jgi:hypothetical protein